MPEDEYVNTSPNQRDTDEFNDSILDDVDEVYDRIEELKHTHANLQSNRNLEMFKVVSSLLKHLFLNLLFNIKNLSTFSTERAKLLQLVYRHR